jgi:transcriptional regulator with XRE-family HTH domain
MTQDEFCEEFRALYHFSGQTLESVAGRMKTSTLTVSRWLEGKSAPVEILRSFTIEAMRRMPRRLT